MFEIQKEGFYQGLLRPIEPRVAGDVTIPEIETTEFYFAIQDRAQNELTGWFNVVVLEGLERGPSECVALLFSRTRRYAYMSKIYLQSLDDVYEQLNEEQRKTLVDIMMEALKHEETHIKLESEKGMQGQVSEHEVDRVAPSFRARELFRLVFVEKEFYGKIQLEHLRGFLAQANEAQFISYMHGLTSLGSDDHLKMAEKLLDVPDPSPIRIHLAQYNLGYILKHENEYSDLYSKAIVLLNKGNIDIDKQNARQYELGIFFRNLVRRQLLIETITKEDGINAASNKPMKINCLLGHWEQLERWIRGTDARSGDSVYLPQKGKTTSLRVKKEKVFELITRLIEDLRHFRFRNFNPEKIDWLKIELERITGNLTENEQGDVVLDEKDLWLIGLPFVSQTSKVISAGGKGTRYAEMLGDAQGNKILLDKAKWAYVVPVDGYRSIGEIALAQANYENETVFREYLTEPIPITVFTSYLTDKDVREDLKFLGYSDREGEGYYGHLSQLVAPVKVVLLPKAELYHVHTADFMRIVHSSLDWENTSWPDAHDSSFVDLIASGRAYELLRGGTGIILLQTLIIGRQNYLLCYLR